MGKGFGELYKLRGIIMYRLSPFELKPFAGILSHGLPNFIRRMKEEFFYVVPPFIIAYAVYDQAEKAHKQSLRKNPADYANDK